MLEIASHVFRKQPALTTAAWIHVGLALLMLIGLALDSRTILGINPWIKPLKFAVSIALFLFTIALLMSYLPGYATVLKWAGVVISTTMLVEIALISMQSIRGTTSHFNFSSGFDSAVFATMGIAIAINTFVVGVVLILYFVRPPAMTPAVLWGIRLGLLAFVIGSLEGYMMVSRLSHSVGGPDGGPGLPFLNWSTRFGDLRIAHFIGLHGLQFIPLVGYLATGGNDPERSGPLSTVAVFGMAGVIFGLMIWAGLQALAGRPLVAVD